MKSYRRILVPWPTDGRGEILLRRAAEMLPASLGDMMVVQVLDTRSGFDSDGPAGQLAEERVARQVPDARKRLDLLLARNNMAWAETRVLCGVPRPTMSDFIRTWKPDLVVTCADLRPEELARDLASEPPDVLTVKCHRLFARLGGHLGHVAHGHA